VDLLRGLVMMLMALDHTREYFSELSFSPEDLSKTFGTLFFTRIITHVCAPVFFLLAGAGAYLAVARGRSLPQVSHFFWTRGLWLVFLELTVLRFAGNFTFASVGLVQVIWALGWSMVAMSLVGYRYLYDDFRDEGANDFLYQMSMHGAQISVGLNF
jgi:uncharacterized membrane protein